MNSKAMKLENITIDVMASDNSLDVTSRPCKIVAYYNKKYPNIGQMADQMRTAKIASGALSASAPCFLNLKSWLNIVHPTNPEETPVIAQSGFELCNKATAYGYDDYYNRGNEVVALAAAITWSKTRIGLRFDRDMYEALMRTPLIGDLPSEVLLHPPHWCLYIYTPGLFTGGMRVHGAYIFLDRDEGSEITNWVFVLDRDDWTLCHGALQLGPWSLERAISQALDPDSFSPGMETEFRRHAEVARAVLEPLMSMYLYVCSKNPDITGEGAQRPEYPQPTNTRRRGPRYYPPELARTWDVGVRIGTAIREAAKRPTLSTVGADTNGRARPRAHPRCAHWHHYWVGKLKSPARKCEVRWLHPTLVNVDDPNLLPMVIRPVKPANDD